MSRRLQRLPQQALCSGAFCKHPGGNDMYIEDGLYTEDGWHNNGGLFTEDCLHNGALDRDSG